MSPSVDYQNAFTFLAWIVRCCASSMAAAKLSLKKARVSKILVLLVDVPGLAGLQRNID
jgi:hypothetical protein